MKLASLYSGGKDSTFAIYMVQKQGHEVSCLLSIYPKSDESHLLHCPNMQWTKLQSESMNIPQLTSTANSVNTEDELSELEILLKRAKEKFQIKGLVHGGIKSEFQKEKFESLCSKLSLRLVSPLWNIEPIYYMYDLVGSGFDFIMITISSDGLDDHWLGKTLSIPDIEKLHKLSEKHGFNLSFEGGEAETFVLNCPLFSKPIAVKKSKTEWDGYRGRFEIVDAELKNHA